MAVDNISYSIYMYPLSTDTEKDYITKIIPFFFQYINTTPACCLFCMNSLTLCSKLNFKAKLQVWIYKAVSDKSYLEYKKKTMTTGEWSCLISFTWTPLTCSERGGSEKFKMKIYVSSGIRTHTTPVHDRKVSALDCSATLVSILKWICDNTCMESVMVWYQMQSSVNNYYTSWNLQWDQKWKFSLIFSSNTHVTIIKLTHVVM